MRITTFAKYVKEMRLQSIRDVDLMSDNFIKHPGHDFKRKRKLSFLQTVMAIIELAKLSLPKELAEIFGFDDD